jgi:hypothetical protein
MSYHLISDAHVGAMQKPPRGAPENARGNTTSKRPVLYEAAARSSGEKSKVGPTATEEDEPVVSMSSTVGVHAVTKLTRRSNKSPNGQNNGPSEDSSAGQRPADLWKSTDEEELKRLVSIHTGPKGIFPG